ncbi:cysteine desulfurase family protein [Brevundimonas sp.]|uniref:cysteine desulfurase family protein n=1 Tax=Brevundimonas sp. TaxID=1871086 RepID=UPI002FCA61D9
MAIYLDYNATALVRPEVRDAVMEAMMPGGNPSAVHALGRKARARVENARAAVAELVGADPTSVIFSSGGTESNAQAIASAVAGGCDRVIVCATEHPCVSEAAIHCGVPVEVMPVLADGQADLVWLEAALAKGGRAFVSLHHANNESGVIQPIAEAAAMVRAAGGWMHVDAIQTLGKIPVDIRDLGADTLTLSSHKIGGTQGVGALVVGENRGAIRIVHGAGQERGLRAGTENVPGIAGFGAAALVVAQEMASGIDHSAWRDVAEARVKAAGATIVGEGAPRLPNTLFMAVPAWDSPQQLITLDLAGVMISAGSACSSGKVKPSKTMVAMGMDDLATGGVRVSGGWNTQEDDWVRFADAWVAAYEKHVSRLGKDVKEVA